MPKLAKHLNKMRRTSALSISAACFALICSQTAYAGSTSYAYDSLGRVRQATFADGSIVVYKYDSSGNRVEVSRTRGNTGPVVQNDSVSTAYLTAKTFDPRSNDSDPDGDTLTITAVSQPSTGTMSFTGTSITYTPPTGFYNNSVSMAYTVTDGNGGTANATATVNVGQAPAPTVGTNTINASYNSSGSTTLTASGVFNANGFAVASQPANGSASISGSTATFTPTSGFIGNTSFTYTASGPGGTSSSATINVNVAAPAAPTVGNTTLTTTKNVQGSVGLTASGVYNANGFAVASQPANGSASISGSTAYFTPSTNFVGTTSFTYTASGPGGTSPTAGTVNVTVNAPVNNPPTCTNWQYTFTYSAPPYGPSQVTWAPSNPAVFTGNCTDSDGGTITLVTPAWPYSTTISRGQTKVIPFTVSDGQGGTAGANVTLIFPN
jgi:YD repeat-containing protein